ncbi:MAG: DoxX family protein [Candidatus Melainabacteria bacterium]
MAENTDTSQSPAEPDGFSADAPCATPCCAPWLMPLMTLLVRLGMGGIFLQSGWAKIQNSYAFYQAVKAYNLLPDYLVLPWARAVPWLEVVLGGMLVLGAFTRLAAAGTAALMLSFIGAISVVLIRGEEIDCGCLVGGVSEPVDGWLLARDILMLLAVLWLCWRAGRQAPCLSVDRLLCDDPAETEETPPPL